MRQEEDFENSSLAVRGGRRVSFPGLTRLFCHLMKNASPGIHVPMKLWLRLGLHPQTSQLQIWSAVAPCGRTILPPPSPK